MSEISFQFPENHPCGAGHFPGNPIIPGALLLDETLSCIAASLGTHIVNCHVKSAKFPMPTRPGDVVLARYSALPSGEIRFECTVSGKTVLSGAARLNLVAATGSAP